MGNAGLDHPAVLTAPVATQRGALLDHIQRMILRQSSRAVPAKSRLRAFTRQFLATVPAQDRARSYRRRVLSMRPRPLSGWWNAHVLRRVDRAGTRMDLTRQRFKWRVACEMSVPCWPTQGKRPRYPAPCLTIVSQRGARRAFARQDRKVGPGRFCGLDHGEAARRHAMWGVRSLPPASIIV